jgi:hypothetical protein
MLPGFGGRKIFGRVWLRGVVRDQKIFGGRFSARSWPKLFAVALAALLPETKYQKPNQTPESNQKPKCPCLALTGQTETPTTKTVAGVRFTRLDFSQIA